MRIYCLKIKDYLSEPIISYLPFQHLVPTISQSVMHFAAMFIFVTPFLGSHLRTTIRQRMQIAKKLVLLLVVTLLILIMALHQIQKPSNLPLMKLPTRYNIVMHYIYIYIYIHRKSIIFYY